MDENGIYEGAEYAYKGKIKPEFIAKARDAFTKYKADKRPLVDRIKSNNEWYKAQYGKTLNPHSNETEPATAFIFSAIENKYADAIDNYPAPNFLEREPSDTETAKVLTKIIPLQLDISGYKKCYKKNWRRKLRDGTGIYGAFYNAANDDIDIKVISILNIYCDMHIDDVQESPFLFITSAIDNDVLRELYPEYKRLFSGHAEIEGYSGINKIDDRTEVMDCYYKKADGTVHMMKFVGGTVIDATEDREECKNGLYEHGKYPVVFDVLYPEEDCPFGFGVVDVIRNPQKYIDKLDGIILKNAILSGKSRWFAKIDSGINEEEFKNLDNDIVHVAGDVGEERVREIRVSPLPSNVPSYRNEKINELKEVIGNRDFQQGGTTGGVTAASAINTLQQAGEKLSRAIIDDGYDAHKELVIMVIDLMREFYTEERVYRITNEAGGADFASFSGNMLYSAVPEKDALGFQTGVKYKRAEFDIDVIPQRQNPFSKEANNQTIMNLWQSGFFLPQNLELSLIALKVMNFDGKDKIAAQLTELLTKRQQQEQIQQQQQMMQQQMPQGGGNDLIPVGQMPAGESQITSDDDLVPVGKVGEM